MPFRRVCWCARGSIRFNCMHARVRVADRVSISFVGCCYADVKLVPNVLCQVHRPIMRHKSRHLVWNKTISVQNFNSPWISSPVGIEDLFGTQLKISRKIYNVPNRTWNREMQGIRPELGTAAHFVETHGAVSWYRVTVNFLHRYRGSSLLFSPQKNYSPCTWSYIVTVSRSTTLWHYFST